MTASSLQDAVPSPPAWARWFRSDDLDEVREAVARIDGEHSRVAHGSGPLGFESALIGGRVCPVGWGRVALPVTIRGALPNPVLHLRMPVGTRYGFGRREILTGPEDVMFVAGGWEFTRHSRSGSILAIGPDENLLLEEIASRGADRPGRLMLSTRRLTIGRPALARLAAALDDFVRDTAPGREPRANQLGEAALLASVADILVEGSAFRPARAATCARLSEVENWIDANLGHPITAGQLCRIAGVSLRGLEKIFESRRGMSPMRFVADRRLAAAHRLLVRAEPGDDVTTIASSVGFTHMGRFSSFYRKAFGETPSATLKRAHPTRS